MRAFFRFNIRQLLVLSVAVAGAAAVNRGNDLWQLASAVAFIGLIAVLLCFLLSLPYLLYVMSRWADRAAPAALADKSSDVDACSAQPSRSSLIK